MGGVRRGKGPGEAGVEPVQPRVLPREVLGGRRLLVQEHEGGVFVDIGGEVDIAGLGMGAQPLPGRRHVALEGGDGGGSVAPAPEVVPGSKAGMEGQRQDEAEGGEPSQGWSARPDGRWPIARP